MPITGPKHRDVQHDRETVWLLPAALEVEPMLAELGQSFAIAPEPPRRIAATWFDTFDWRLFSRGFLLYHDRSAWHLVNRDSGEGMAVLDAPGLDDWRFSREFPASRVRSLLEPLLANRRLLRLFSSESATVGLRILNRDSKTVAHVVRETHRVEGSANTISTLCLRGVRGYDRDFAAISSFFSSRGITDEVGPYSFFAQGVRSGGRVPLDYTSKFRPLLRPEMTARQAMAIVYRDLLAIMRRNADGTIKDLDAEFLHDFRVAVRRTRSGLGQVRKVLPAGVTDTFRKGFAWLGEVTGPVRDLDVYLQAETDYLARLPAELRHGLAPFFTELRERRIRERQLLVRRLRSRKYRELEAAWQKVLADGGGDEATKNSELPVGRLAARIIDHRFRRMLKAGKEIQPTAPDQEYHRLRIQGKKLRYILEFFSSLFPEEALEPAVRQLKRLQDNLGAYNDLVVQQGELRAYLSGLRPGSRRNLQLAAAIGGLLISLRDEQDRVREEFANRFAEFSRPENTVLYRKYCRQEH
ncbi:MAG: CHAD domain-containing protein [Desulfobulbaceae bacterium]